MNDDDSVLHAWKGLLSTQVSFVRELWNVGSHAARDPSTLRTRATQFWGRWSSPAAWFGGAAGERPTGPREGGLQFVVDQEAEATSEQRVTLPAGSHAPGDPLRPTALKNVSAAGEIAGGQVEARVSSSAAGVELRVALVDLAETQRRLRAGEIEPGLYVGAILGGRDGQQPLAIVQAVLTGAR